MAKEKKQSLINKVRTRIAPSPTGNPHVGTAFQALLDYVYARRYDGQFILRIEDTDQKRLVQGVEQNLFDAFKWLGIEPDEGPQQGGAVGPYRQSERLSLYQQYAQQLVAQGDAYYCFCSPERLTQVREAQKKQGLAPQYDGHCRNLSLQAAQQRLEQGEKAVIRLKVPTDEIIKVNDVLRGVVEFATDNVDDQVLIKSDGFPTYHLAVVVDDHLMKITHVVRGEEWLPSAPKHVLLYRFFNWPAPELIHTPTLRNTDRSKLSKRKGNTSLWWYREQGFLPQALLNFLGLMVWKPNGNQEIFSLSEMIAKFEWREMNITGPIFDVTKLEWLNGKYLRQLSATELEQQFLAWFTWAKTRTDNPELMTQMAQLQTWLDQDEKMFHQAIKLSNDRSKKFLDLIELMGFYFADQLNYDLDDLLQAQPAQTMVHGLTLIKERLTVLRECDQPTWEKTIRAVADELKLEHKVLFMSLRSALTAEKFTPPLYEVMQVLGTQQVEKRIQDAINYLLNL